MAIANPKILICDGDELALPGNCVEEVEADTAAEARKKGRERGWRVVVEGGKNYDLCPRHNQMYAERRTEANAS
jgi:hypothetical protein